MAGTTKATDTTVEIDTPLSAPDLTPKQVALLCAQAQGWRPENVGAEVEGTILQIKIGRSDVGVREGEPLREYPIVFILAKNSTVKSPKVTVVHGFHTVLEQELMSSRPEPGDDIYIGYLGDMGRQAEKGRSAPEIYAVHVTKVNPVTATSPWDLLANGRQGSRYTNE